jgi:hypothetical protein
MMPRNAPPDLCIRARCTSHSCSGLLTRRSIRYWPIMFAARQSIVADSARRLPFGGTPVTLSPTHQCWHRIRKRYRRFTIFSRPSSGPETAPKRHQKSGHETAMKEPQKSRGVSAERAPETRPTCKGLPAANRRHDLCKCRRINEVHGKHAVNLNGAYQWNVGHCRSAGTTRDPPAEGATVSRG